MAAAVSGQGLQIGQRSTAAKQQLEEAHEALRMAQQLVNQREKELMEAVVKDGAVATTATAATVALNPATAAKVGAATTGMAKGATAVALGWKQHLIAGGFARGIAVGTLFPVDAIKTQAQAGVGGAKPIRIGELGPEHFRGFGSAVGGQIPYGMLVFGTYEITKSKIFARYPEAPKLPVFLACAVLGDVVGSIWLTPSEIIKQRLQAGTAKSTQEAVMDIYGKQGFKGFYQGFSGLVARDLPYRAMQLPLYEVAREAYSDKYCAPYKRVIMPHEAMCVGATVGMFAAGLTTPLDVVKSRMMVGKSAGLPVGQVIKDIVKEHGVKGLFAGWQQRVGYLGLSNAIFFIMYEFCRGIMVEKPTIDMH